MERCRQIFCSRNFILSALRADSAGTCWNTIKYKSFRLKNESLGKSPWDLNRRRKKTVSPCLLGTITKPPKGGKGGNYKTLGRLKYSNLAIQLGMRNRTFTTPFIVRVLSQGMPMKKILYYWIERAPKVLHVICRRKIIFTSHTKQAIHQELA